MPTARSRLGTYGEGVARKYLKGKGYRIVDTNFRCPWGEVDIVAQEGVCLVFVEVRTRRDPLSYGTPEESLTRRKRDKLVATAETYIQGCTDSPEEWRIDLIGVYLDSRSSVERVVHVANAVELT